MIEDYSNSEIVELLGRRFREYRLNLNLSQEHVCSQSGVSIATLRNFESGKAHNISLGVLLSLMRCIGIVSNAESLMPEQPENPFRIIRKSPRQRASKKTSL